MSNNYFKHLNDGEKETKFSRSVAASEAAEQLFRGFKDKIVIDHQIVADDAETIVNGLMDTYWIKHITIKRYVPEVIKAVRDGLKENDTVTHIILEDDEENELLTLDVMQHLKEILSIPSVLFTVQVQNFQLFDIIKGSSARHIEELYVEGRSKQLDDVLFELRTNKVLNIMNFERKDLDMKCNNLFMLANFKQLKALQIQIRPDECQQFFKTIKQLELLYNLCISNSRIAPQAAHHFAEMLSKTKQLRYLRLTNCSIDNKILSIIWPGLLQNKSIEFLNLRNNPFNRLDLIPQKSQPRRKFTHFSSNTYDINMASTLDLKTFDFHCGTNFDGLKVAQIKKPSFNLQSTQQVIDVFNALKENMFIRQIAICIEYELTNELCRQLINNKTLKVVDTNACFSDENMDQLCKLIEYNNTIEHLVVHFETEDVDQLFESLLKNTSLTVIDCSYVPFKPRKLEEILIRKPFLSFKQLPAMPRQSRAPKLNEKNRQNAQRRLNDTKCNVISFARSNLVTKLPMELWELIMKLIDLSDVDYLSLFKGAKTSILIHQSS